MALTLTLQPEPLAVLLAEAQAAYPEECCGFLLGAAKGDWREVTLARPVHNNSSAAKARHFAISPRDYLAAERAADAAGLTLLGIYHSHPDHPAQPSPTDLEHAQPWFSYLIVSVRGGEPAAWTSHRLAEDGRAFLPEVVNPATPKPISTD